MPRPARFQVDSRLAKLLSQEYRSSESALKELVDNAWDADASVVRITLPKPMSSDPITVADDGTGMTRAELERHYLFIAADRRSTRGDRTPVKKRLVKGRKGIGKFAGLMIASDMHLETRARGSCSRFAVRLEELAKVQDIERLPIVVEQVPCPDDQHGTIVALSGLLSGLSFPDPGRLRQVLLQEYGRATDFLIYVDGKALGIDDVAGSYVSHVLDVAGVGEVRLDFAIAEGRAVTRQPGLVIRVDGKAIGKPTLLGLDEQEDFPQKLLAKLHGEITADGLRDHVTAGWDAIIENSELLESVKHAALPRLRDAFKERYGREIRLAQARLQREINERLARLPEHRRAYTQRALQKILERYYGEPPSKYEPFVFVLLEAMEHADYEAVLAHLAEAPRRDVAAVADALNDFGLAELAFLVTQANARSAFLDKFEELANEPSTLESQMHKALENNLWALGPEFSVFASNKTLKSIAERVGQTIEGAKGRNRPDLLLTESLRGESLLIEFKRPSHALRRIDYTQATDYRHELIKLSSKPVTVLVIGGSRDPDFPTANREPGVEAWSYTDLVAAARRYIDWQLRSRAS